MKKRIFATMCVALVATALTACGGKDENTTEDITTTTEATEEVTTETTQETEESTGVNTTEDTVDVKDDETSSTSADNATEDNSDIVVEEDITDDDTVTDTKSTYTYGPFTFEMPAEENSYVAQLEAAGLISKGQLDGTYIEMDEKGNFIVCMPGTDDGELYDIGYPGEDGNVTDEQLNTVCEAIYAEYDVYESGEKSAVDFDGNGDISSSEYYICAVATCGFNIRGMVGDKSHE